MAEPVGIIVRDVNGNTLYREEGALPYLDQDDAVQEARLSESGEYLIITVQVDADR